MLTRLFWHWAVLALGLYLLTLIAPLGITYDSPRDLLSAALVLILANTFIRPILIFFTLPLVIFSLGLFILVINGLILKFLPHLVHGFHVPSFTSAFFGAILLSLITGIFGRLGKRDRRTLQTDRRRREVIDV